MQQWKVLPRSSFSKDLRQILNLTPSTPRGEHISFRKTPGGMDESHFSNRSWFGVRGSGSAGSPERKVLGRLFKMLSTSHIRVTRPSSSTVCSWRRARTILSLDERNANVVWAIKGVKTPLDILLQHFSATLLFLAWIDSRSSRSPLVPLSDFISRIWPLFAINLSTRRNESVSRLWATSVCTARTVRQVNRTPDL